MQELKEVRNCHASFAKGILPGLAYTGTSVLTIAPTLYINQLGIIDPLISCGALVCCMVFMKESRCFGHAPSALNSKKSRPKRQKNEPLRCT